MSWCVECGRALPLGISSCESCRLIGLIRGQQSPDPRHLGGYTILAELEHDEFATRFLGERQADHRIVVIKIPRPSKLFQLQHEADLVRRLRSPNCSGLIEDGLGQPIPYLVLRFVEGEPFLDWLRSRCPPLREVMQILAQGCEELHQAAHLEGVYHLNIRPESLLITPQGRVGWINFGAGGLATYLTADTTSTIGLHAPESQTGQVRLRADLVGLGRLIRIGCGGDPLSEQLPDHVPRPLARLIDRCQDQNPTHRFRTALELAESLRRWAEGKPEPGESWIVRGYSFLERHRLVSLLITIATVGIIILIQLLLT